MGLFLIWLFPFYKKDKEIQFDNMNFPLCQILNTVGGHYESTFSDIIITLISYSWENTIMISLRYLLK